MEIPVNQFASFYITVIYDTLTVPSTTTQPFTKVLSVSYIAGKINFRQFGDMAFYLLIRDG